MDEGTGGIEDGGDRTGWLVTERSFEIVGIVGRKSGEGGKEADRDSWVAEKRGKQDDGDGEECGGGGTTNLSGDGGGGLKRRLER